MPYLGCALFRVCLFTVHPHHPHHPPPTSNKAKGLHCPGIEPGSQEWESCMIPLHQQCPHNDKNVKFCQFIGQKGTQGAAGLAPRVTTIHPTSYKAKGLHCPGIEPGLQEWESCMIPLHQRRSIFMSGTRSYDDSKV